MTTDENGAVTTQAAQELERSWRRDPRWDGLKRDYSAEDVVRLRGRVRIEHTLSDRGSKRLWDLMRADDFVPALGALTGAQAVQMVRAGLKSIYVSGWQVAADNNLGNHMYPDMSLYPWNSVSMLVRRINNSLMRQDQISCLEGRPDRDWLVPIVADGEAGFGGPLNAFEVTKGLIEAGAAGVHFEDQLGSAKKCGHMGGKVLIPVSHHVRTLTAARLAADVMGIPFVLVARTDAHSATLLSTVADDHDEEFTTGERTVEGYFVVRPGLEAAIRRALAFAPYSDVLWFETSEPDLEEARTFARAVHRVFPNKLLAYNCSPSFNWRKHHDDDALGDFQKKLGRMGYKFQFVTLAGFHTLTLSMYELAHAYVRHGMRAYAQVQEREFALEPVGYTAVRHQQEVGTAYFDQVSQAIVGRSASTLAMHGSTERQQFTDPQAPQTNGGGSKAAAKGRARPVSATRRR